VVFEFLPVYPALPLIAQNKTGIFNMNAQLRYKIHAAQHGVLSIGKSEVKSIKIFNKFLSSFQKKNTSVFEKGDGNFQNRHFSYDTVIFYPFVCRCSI